MQNFARVKSSNVVSILVNKSKEFDRKYDQAKKSVWWMPWH